MTALITRVSKDGAPLIEGNQVTFVWQGPQAPTLIGDFNHWGRDLPALPMQPAGPELWSATISLPTDAYFEYAFVVQGQRVPDPLNACRVDDGLGHTNSYFWMPDAVDTPLIRAQDDLLAARLTEHSLPTEGLLIGESRRVVLYQPPVSEPCPLVVVLDGQDYLARAHLPAIVDNLIAQRRIQPIALALVANGDAARRIEYACSDTTLAFLFYHVLPLAKRHLHLLDVESSPGAYGMLGASMGGLMGLYTGMRIPHVFGRILCQSGAFGADDPAYRLYYRSVIDDLVDLLPTRPLTLWMDVGQYEWFLEPNRTMLARLRGHGYSVNYLEHSSGHNYPSWRNVVWQGLEYLFRR